MDAYNAAFKFLGERVGLVRGSLTEAGHDRIRKDPKERENGNNYFWMLDRIPEGDYVSKKVSLLMNQYYYGVAAKNDLKNLLGELGVEFNT